MKIKDHNALLIASDHGGYRLKEEIKLYLKDKNIKYIDLGTEDENSADYPDFAHKLAKMLSDGVYKRGILICGTGIGMSIAANRYTGVRGALCHNAFTADMSRRHNDSNLLILGQRVISKEAALEILSIWIETEFEYGRHKRRVDKIDQLI